MGSFLSCCESGEDRCQHCNRTNLVVTNNECESCLSRRRYLQRQQNKQHESIPLRQLFGEYKCRCGRTWSSRASWPSRYLICYRCKQHVYAHYQRELRSTDMSRDRKNVQDHRQEMCQMCMELGYYCGKLRY